MKCPKCQTENIGDFTVDGVTVNRCAACDGVWFDAQELGELLAEDARQVSALLRGRSHDKLIANGRNARATARLCCVFTALSINR